MTLARLTLARTAPRLLFCYGTLLDATLRRRVCGGLAAAGPARPAVLPGYRRIRMPGCSYPVLVPAPGAVVRGRLVRLGGAAALRRVVWYEGGRYRLIPVSLRSGGRGVAALAFLPVGGRRRGGTWSYHRWRRCHRAAALAVLGRSLVRAAGPMPSVA